MRVSVVTAGHLSTCPRMVKAADALHDAGHTVHVVSTRSTDWATAADDHLRSSRRWSWSVVDVTPAGGEARRRWSGLRHRAARAVASRVDVGALPWFVVGRAFGRVGPELAREVADSGPDVVFAGTSGALAAARDAASTRGVRYGLDLEDFHTAEREDDGARVHHRLADRVLASVLPGAALVTTSSRGMAQAYRSRYGVEPLVIHNVWPRPSWEPRSGDDGPLRFYWFSQTIGPARGLEPAIRAIGAASIDATLVVRGRALPGYDAHLVALAASAAPRLTLALVPPVPPDTMASSCESFDVGLATEIDTVENRRLALSNKLFMYLTTGLAVMATPTPAQRSVLDELGAHVAWLDPDRPEALAPMLRRWSEDRGALLAARQAAWHAAAHRWHWEHALERGAFLEAFARAFS